MRSKPLQLPIAAYPFRTDIDVRLADLDFARHVNNAAVAAFYEETRVRFHLSYFGADAVFNRPAGGGVVAQVSIQYLRETVYGTPVTGCAGIAQLGNSSYTLAQALFQGDHCVSEATCVIAQRENGRAAPLSEALQGRLSELMVAAGPP
jgi:acyl-CoA thioester hydrolase